MFISTSASLVCCMGKYKITSRVYWGFRVFPYFSPKAESAQANPGTAATSASVLLQIFQHQELQRLPSGTQVPAEKSFPKCFSLCCAAEMQLTGERLDAVQTHHRAALNLKGRKTSPNKNSKGNQGSDFGNSQDKKNLFLWEGCLESFWMALGS